METTNLEKPDTESLRKQKIARRLAQIPKKYRKIYKKAVETNNKTEAVNALCLECVCWQKTEIINCSCLACPLYGLRPYTKETDKEPKKNAAAKKQLSNV